MEISTAISPGTIAHSGGRKMAGKSEKTEGSADFAGLLALGMTARQSVGAATAPADAPLGESLAASPLPATGKPGGKGLPVVPAAPGTMEAGHEAAGEAEETSEEAVPGDPVPRIEIVFAPVGLPATAQAAPTPERAVPQRGGVAVPSLPQPQGQIQSQPLSQPTTLPEVAEAEARKAARAIAVQAPGLAGALSEAREAEDPLRSGNAVPAALRTEPVLIAAVKFAIPEVSQPAHEAAAEAIAARTAAPAPQASDTPPLPSRAASAIMAARGQRPDKGEAPLAPAATAASRLPELAADLGATLSEPAAPVVVTLASPTSPALASPAAASAAAPIAGPQDFQTLVDRLAEAREAASPQTVSAALSHGDFGRVSLVFRHEERALSVAMTSNDPGFAPAVQAAAISATLPGQPAQDSGASPQRQDAQSQTAGQQQAASGQGQSQGQAAAQSRAHGHGAVDGRTAHARSAVREGGVPDGATTNARRAGQRGIFA